MVTSPGREVDNTSFLTKVSLFFYVLLPLAIDKPPKDLRDFTHAVSASLLMPPRTMIMAKSKSGEEKKKLYITFDDGPNRGTRNVLRIAEEEEVPVSFFVVGRNAFASPLQNQLWDSLKMARHIDVCNHSFNHAYRHYQNYYSKPTAVVADFKRTTSSLALTNNIGRTPGRNIWRMDTIRHTDLAKSTAAADSLQKAGFRLIGWDLEWRFNPRTMCMKATAEEMIVQIDSAFKQNRTRKKDNLVLLAHDQAYASSEDSLQLRQFFQLLKKGNYELLLVRDYSEVMNDTTRLQ